MAKIRGPVTGHATLTGTAADDLIVALGDYNTVTGGGGNDTILATQGNDNSIFVGELSDGLTGVSDLIRIDGLGDTIRGGDEAVRLTGMASSTSVTLGNGNNRVFLQGSANAILLGAGNDSVNALGGSDTIHVAYDDGSGYSDRIAISGLNNVVTNAQSAGEYTGTGHFTISGGSGSNTFDLNSGVSTINTAGESNVFNITGYGSSHIVAGSGSDTVNIQGVVGSGNGEQDIQLAGQHSEISGVAGAATISGGAGDNSINLAGPDVGGGSLDIQLGGLGNSLVILAAHATVNAGTGADTVSLQSAIGSVTFTGSGDMLALSGTGIYAGAPDAYVNDRSSGLAIDLLAGGAGNLTIDHLDATGLISFDGRGGFSSVNQVVSDLQATGNGSYSLALPDGSGTITFLHTPNLNASNFKV